jgi:diadenosine tetraphosphate (Ap4A) HIT family hydrolase
MVKLHPQLEANTIPLGRFALCLLLLYRDANYPWFILVPDREGVKEVYELNASDQHKLMRESSYLARQLARGFRAHKMNIAALGNMVAQLHIHHIVRYRDDPAWPHPVWGRYPARPYAAAEVEALKSRMGKLLQKDFSVY